MRKQKMWDSYRDNIDQDKAQDGKDVICIDDNVIYIYSSNCYNSFQ